MRTSTFIVSMGMVLLLLGCVPIHSERQPADGVSAGTHAVPDPHAAEQNVEISPASAVAPNGHPAEPNVEVSGAPMRYEGPTSFETRIFKSPVIARVRLDSVSLTTEPGPTYRGVKHIALLEFNFSVLEYVKGNGADDIVAVWAAESFDTQQEAEDALPAFAAARDARWDTHDAIVFLQNSAPYIPSTQQVDRFFFSGVHLVVGRLDDYFSLSSRGNKLWLPAEAAASASSQPTGDQQRFLTDVPPATGTAPTITLGELKTRIATVTAKLAAGDGSEEYRECVRRTYLYERINQYSISTGGDGYFSRTPNQKLASGLPSSSVVLEKQAYGRLPNFRAEVWLEGEHADLFSVVYGELVPHDSSGDGVLDSIRHTRRIVSARPLPEGTYTTDYNRRDASFVRCEGYSYHHDWTITVTAPEGTLHEAFFDPVTDGTAVAADDTNGVLKPATFADVDGASATIGRIAWEPSPASPRGKVKLEIDPPAAIAGHIVSFIALDGSVPLALKVADATADAANDTLSWSVESQPWEDGEKLMLRIRDPRRTCSNGTVVPNPSTKQDLVRDCSTLLAAKNALRGTATLNWSFDTPITDWDGIRVHGSPARVTHLILMSKSLNGTLPPDLGRLDGLRVMWLGFNQLAGEIPAELGSMASLESLTLHKNQLTGAIPAELANLANLTGLWLNSNQLTGEIPPDLGDMPNLDQLLLSDNQLTGTIPSELGDLSKLTALALSDNQLTGEIPSELGDLSNLESLLLSSNQLTGCIPPALRNVARNDLASLTLQDCATTEE